MLDKGDMPSAAAAPDLVLGAILILEEEILLSTLLETQVRDMGATQVFVLGDADEALRVASEAAIDCAILDVHVGDRTSFAVADALSARGIPFLFSSAARQLEVEERHQGRPWLSKPFGDEELRLQLLALLRG